MAEAALPISVDWQTGAVSNASALEWLGLRAMGLAASLLAPLDSLGLSYAVTLISKVLPSNRLVCLEFAEDENFAFPYGDKYWSRMLKRGSRYEVEVEDLLEALKSVDYVFVDCGANYGYWSVRVTSKRFGSHPAVAIELDPVTFERLQSNASYNEGRFECLNRAVFDRDGEILEIYGHKHEARTVDSGNQTGVSHGKVSSSTLDTIMSDAGKQDCQSVILKLDVEGVEIKALQGANALLKNDVLVIYEDHGSDQEHTISKFLAESHGMRLFAHDNNRFFELTDLAELNSLKTNRRKGYDFFATRSQVWLDRLAGLVAGQSGPVLDNIRAAAQ